MVLNGIAGKVQGHGVSVRDGRFFLALQRFREGKNDPFAAETPAELRSAVQRILLEEMVFLELKSLKFEAGPRAEAEAIIRERKKKAAPRLWESLLKTYGKTEAEAIDTVWKSLQVERFIQKRIETMTPILSASEVDAFIRQRETARRLDEAELVKLRPQASMDLRKERTRKELEEWISLLKKKYSVVNYLEPVPG